MGRRACRSGEQRIRDLAAGPARFPSSRTRLKECLKVPENQNSSGPWEDATFAQLERWQAAWARACLAISRNPWTGNILPRELVALAVNCAWIDLNREGTCHPIRQDSTISSRG